VIGDVPQHPLDRVIGALLSSMPAVVFLSLLFLYDINQGLLDVLFSWRYNLVMEKKAQESDNGQGTPSKGTRQISFHGIRSILKNAAFLLLIIFIMPRCSTGNDPDTNTLDNNQNSEDVIKILFIGNSLTYTNDIPGLLERLAEKGSKHVFVDEITIPGAPLARHITNSPSLEKIRSQKWDYVILQSGSSHESVRGIG